LGYLRGILGMPSGPSRRWHHAKKDVRKALRYAEQAGWTVLRSGSHRWGYAHCGVSGSDRCEITIFSTPRNATAHAKEIRRLVDRCPHRPKETM
jgi:hypothetical protein